MSFVGNPMQRGEKGIKEEVEPDKDCFFKKSPCWFRRGKEKLIEASLEHI